VLYKDTLTGDNVIDTAADLTGIKWPAMNSENSPTLAGKCPVVAFGASAGGLEAFADLLKHLPTDLGAALVLILHLSPDHESLVTELLPRWAPIPVSVAADRIRVEPDRVVSGKSIVLIRLEIPAASDSVLR
jgi:chemotaxis response regulator CheB